MPLTLHVDAPRWRAHVHGKIADAAAHGVAVVPVTKGNGYGFGNQVLAAEAATLDVPAMAVGTYPEVADVSGAFGGDVLVLSPWRPWQAGSTTGDRVVHTVSRAEDLRLLAQGDGRPRVVVELLTSMRRHGVAKTELADLPALLEGVRFEGFALHLPLVGHHVTEATELAERAFAALPAARRTLWVSHVSPAEAAAIGAATAAEMRLRVATNLWLGDRAALRPRATVIDVHTVSRGERYGYRQRRAKRDGTVLVVTGGTAHGVALQAPTAAVSLRQRAVAAATGVLESAGMALSPFRVAGKQRWFAEPPHMQCSLVWLPAEVKPPSAGDEVDVEVRFTTTAFDRIEWGD